METKEEKNSENKFCGTVNDNWRITEMMSECCKGMMEKGDGNFMMSECMKKCRWFPLIPVIFGIALLMLGYYLDAEVTRILWMIFAGMMILMGTCCLLMMSNTIRSRHRAK